MSDRSEAIAAGDRRPLVFSARAPAAPALPVLEPWKLMISDDDEDVHLVSRMLLKDFSFEGRSLAFLSARSGGETEAMLREHPDTAVLLLDVVMETDHAGLEVVRHIRETLKNRFVRIILRTGQPGQAPEKQVVEEYDINDYREKTELTAQKLVTTVMSALRAYRDLTHLESSRQGLERIIGGSTALFQRQSLRRFSIGVLTQLAAVLDLRKCPLTGLTTPSGPIAAARRASSGPSGLALASRAGVLEVTAAIGDYAGAAGLDLIDAVPPELAQRLAEAAAERRSQIGGQDFVGYFRSSTGIENLVYLRSRRSFDALETSLLGVYGAILGVGFDNVHLNYEIADTQADLVQRLCDVVETRSSETGRHTLRVGRIAHRLAEKLGLDEDATELMRVAAPLHDLGKVGIPDAILNKPSALTAEEFDLVKTHSVIGYNILKGSPRKVLKTAAIVCLHHHERWDGKGYPHGLTGERIDLMGRIVGLADVFDAISHHRLYKEAWPLDRVYAYIKSEREKQFDPELVDLFISDFAEFCALLTARDQPHSPLDPICD